MNQKKTSVYRLQKQINRELSFFTKRKPTSLTSLPSQSSLRSSLSKSVKFLCFDDINDSLKNKSENRLRTFSPKSFPTENLLGRSQNILEKKRIKSKDKKLKKKRSLAFDKQFTTMSRKDSQPTQLQSQPSTFSSISDNEYLQLVQKNKIYEEKINRQNSLIRKLETIIQDIYN